MAYLYILMGIPGAGKTTFAKTILKNAVWISSDQLRKELLGKEMTLQKHAYIHKIMKKQMYKHLSNGKDVVIDCSNLRRKQRESYFKYIPKNTKVILIFINTPLLQCLKNNLKRERHVPELGLLFMYFTKQNPKKTERFNKIIKIENNLKRRTI